MLFQSIKKTPSFFNPKDVLIEAGLTEEQFLAELGCGAGHFVQSATRLVGSKGKVFAVDIQREVLLALRSAAKMWGVHNLKLVWANLEKSRSMKIADESIDFAVLASTLHQIKNRRVVFLEAKRILRDGGKLVVVDWKKEALPFGPHFSLRIGKEQLLKEAKEASFEYLNDLTTDQYHYAFLLTIAK